MQACAMVSSNQHIHMCVYIYIHICMRGNFMQACAMVSRNQHVCGFVRVFARVRIYIHTCIHTYIHIGKGRWRSKQDGGWEFEGLFVQDGPSEVCVYVCACECMYILQSYNIIGFISFQTMCAALCMYVCMYVCTTYIRTFIHT